MRRYEYRCPACGRTEDHFRPTAERDDPVPCSHCGEPAERLLSTFIPTGPTQLFSPPGGTPPPPPEPFHPPPRPRRRF